MQRTSKICLLQTNHLSLGTTYQCLYFLVYGTHMHTVALTDTCRIKKQQGERAVMSSTMN